MKFLIVIVGMFAISNAAFVYRVGTVDPFVAPIAPAVLSLVAKEVPETELADWESYKEKFGKVYFGIEDRLRRNIYFANKEKVAKYDKLIELGIGLEKIQLDIFADQTRDEIFSLRSIIEESQKEWNDYKLTYGKIYDSYTDKFHKTIFFIIKDLMEAHNKMATFGLVSTGLTNNIYSDYFHDELPADSYELSLTPVVLPLARVALPYTAPVVAATYPGAYAKFGFYSL